jgi:predicted glycoside hydrolase/deacetylase ChbG (UPF0249 family)
LIVNGDDFGASLGINRGIVEAHERGVLTSASLMVDRPAAADAVTRARANPALSVGLHLELDSSDPARAASQCAHQLARFLDLTGASPTHVDSHHDLHRDPGVLPYVLALARSAGVPVRGHSTVRHVGKFYGQWGGATHAEQIGVDGFVRVLAADLGPDVTELSCHPGYVDAGFRSSYRAEREIELRTLCDPRVRRAIHERGITLIGFRDLSQRVAAAMMEAP